MVTLQLIDNGTEGAPALPKAGRNSRTRAQQGTEGDRSTPGTRIVKRIADLLTSEDLEGAVQVWRDGMEAQRLVWSAKLKMYVEAGPDWDTRRECSELIVAYMEGRPMERQLNLNGSFLELGELLRTVRLSGEARRLIPGLDSLPSTP